MLVIKILVIVPTNLVSAIIRILSLKIIPVCGMSPIPRIPARPIPAPGSYNIAKGICVIGCKSISRAEEVIQDSIQKPITIVKDPWRRRPNPRCRVNILGRGWIALVCGWIALAWGWIALVRGWIALVWGWIALVRG